MWTILLFSHSSRIWLFATLWMAAGQASLSFTISRGLLKLMSIESVMPSNHLILFKSLYWIRYTIASVICFRFFGPQPCRVLSSLTRDRTQNPCIGRWNLSHWTTREVPASLSLKISVSPTSSLSPLIPPHPSHHCSSSSLVWLCVPLFAFVGPSVLWFRAQAQGSHSLGHLLALPHTSCRNGARFTQPRCPSASWFIESLPPERLPSQLERRGAPRMRRGVWHSVSGSCHHQRHYYY